MDQVQRLTGIIQLAIGVQVLLTTAISGFIIFINLKARAEFAVFKLDMLKTIAEELDDYVTTKYFAQYSESHSKEHLDIHAEITRLRDFRHDINTELAKLGMKVEDIDKRSD